MASVEEGVSVVTVGRTTPVPAGQNTSANSLPVVVPNYWIVVLWLPSNTVVTRWLVDYWRSVDNWWFCSW